MGQFPLKQPTFAIKTCENLSHNNKQLLSNFQSQNPFSNCSMLRWKSIHLWNKNVQFFKTPIFHVFSQTYVSNFRSFPLTQPTTGFFSMKHVNRVHCVDFFLHFLVSFWSHLRLCERKKNTENTKFFFSWDQTEPPLNKYKTIYQHFSHLPYRIIFGRQK